jgi:PTS system mannose-specific IIA component
MVKIIIITHENLAEGLLSASRFIMGKQENVYAFGLFEGEGIEILKEKILPFLSFSKDENKVLFLVDLFGATPYNVAMILYNILKKENIESAVITGVNLPMLIEVIDSRSKLDFKNFINHILNISKESIINGVEILDL